MPTRLYLSRLTSAPVSPAFAGWEVNDSSTRLKLLAAKDAAESVGAIGFSSGATNGVCAQFVSDGLQAQTINGTLKAYARCRDIDLGGVAFTNLYAAVVSADGSAVRGVLLALGSHGSGLPFAGITNRAFADGDALSAVNAQAGDRLVVELGASDANGGLLQIRIGAPLGSDLPEDETTITDLVPWVEFSGSIGFQSASANGAPNILLLGVG